MVLGLSIVVLAEPKPKAKAQALDYYGEYGEGDYNYADYGEAGDYSYGQGECDVSDVMWSLSGEELVSTCVMLIIGVSITCVPHPSSAHKTFLHKSQHTDTCCNAMCVYWLRQEL